MGSLNRERSLLISLKGLDVYGLCKPFRSKYVYTERHLTVFLHTCMTLDAHRVINKPAEIGKSSIKRAQEYKKPVPNLSFCQLCKSISRSCMSFSHLFPSFQAKNERFGDEWFVSKFHHRLYVFIMFDCNNNI
jgi:hypothetical protein